MTLDDVIADLKRLRKRWRTEATKAQRTASDSSRYAATVEGRMYALEDTANELDRLIRRMEEARCEK